VSERRKYLHVVAFSCRDLDISPMTLKLEGDLEILKMYLPTKNCSVLVTDETGMAITSEMNKVKGQGHMSSTSNHF